MFATESASGAAQRADACVDGTYGKLRAMHASRGRAVAVEMIGATPTGSAAEHAPRFWVRSTDRVLGSDQHDSKHASPLSGLL